MVHLMCSMYGKMLWIFFKSLGFFFLIGSKNLQMFVFSLFKKQKGKKEKWKSSDEQ